MAAPNQRKKTDKTKNEQQDKQATAAAATINNKKPNVAEQLDRAEATVERNQQTALTLHQQWRTHLLRMALIVMVVTFHQLQTPSAACVTEIKEWNKIKKNSMEEAISGYQATTMVLHDSAVEIAGIVCCACLLWCLRLESIPGQSDFTTVPYRLSCAMIPMIVSLYFFNKTMGCIHDDMMQHTIEDAPARAPRGFPVVLLFHSICSISLWFMQFQVSQHDKNIKMVRQLKQDLTDAQTAKKRS